MDTTKREEVGANWRNNNGDPMGAVVYAEGGVDLTRPSHDEWDWHDVPSVNSPEAATEWLAERGFRPCGEWLALDGQECPDGPAWSVDIEDAQR